MSGSLTSGPLYPYSIFLYRAPLKIEPPKTYATSSMPQ